VSFVQAIDSDLSPAQGAGWNLTDPLMRRRHDTLQTKLVGIGLQVLDLWEKEEPYRGREIAPLRERLTKKGK
jgi:hypothetical protein